MEKTKVMITGCEGFVGKHLRTFLLGTERYEILSFDIKNSVTQDIKNERLLNAFMDKHQPEVVIHLAANPDIPTSAAEPETDGTLNIVGTINVLEACRKHGIKLKQFLFASSAQVYGEPKGERIDESHPLDPKSPYAISKLAAENYIQYYHQKHALPTTIFRFFNIYGPGQLDWVVIPKLIKRVSTSADGDFEMYGSPEDSRDFIYIKDICRAFDLAMQKRAIGEVINLGTGRETLILDLAKIIAKLHHKSLNFIYSNKIDSNKISKLTSNPDKAWRLLNWRSEYTVEEGIKSILE